MPTPIPCAASVENANSQSGSARRTQRTWWTAFILSAVCNTRGGQPLEDYDFSLRFPAAISRFASYADIVAEGGAQAASEYSSSGNPASAAWPKAADVPKFRTSLSPQFSAIGFVSGNRLYVTTEAATIDAGKWGVFLPAAAQVTSNHEQQKDVGFHFDARHYPLQWAKLIARKWTIGVIAHVTSSYTSFYVDGFRAGRRWGKNYDFLLELVHQVLPKLRIGFVINDEVMRSKTTAAVFNPATFVFDTLRTIVTAHEVLVRTGIVWRYAKCCDMYFDFEGGTSTDSTGTLQVHLIPIGIEHSLNKHILFLRADTLSDTHGNVALTTGIGVALSDRASLDARYQLHMLPEIRQEFGVAQTFALSLAADF